MGTVIEAVYDGKTFRPLKKVNLPKGAKVKVIVGETIWNLLEEIGGIPIEANVEEVLEDVRGRKRVRY
ncbi:MAG: antitoxin family protein [Thermococcus sp.]|nr:antitoxin family protein [Thermococcus sp.]